MRTGTGLNRRLTRLAVGRHLPHRTVRRRLTLLYGGLFLLSGAALLTITYLLFVNATGFVFTEGNGLSTEVVNGQPSGLAVSVPSYMRKHPSASRLNPQLVIASFTAADRRRLNMAANNQHAHVLRYLALESGIALAGMSVLSLLLGWVVAGRVLQPLEDSYRAQRQFVANASHELRAPLTRQRALIQVALADPDASFDSLRVAHERVLASEQDLEQLIEGLLALTRGQAGLERGESFDLATVTSEALLTREAQLDGADLDVQVTLESAPALGDPRLIERLATNLLDNAIRHNVPSGRIEIVTGSRDGRAFMSVTNTGPEISPDAIERLFKPFERLGDARTRHDNGHGLGLSIVRAVADAHRADLSARALPTGGFAVEIVFPAEAAIRQPAERRRTRTPLAPRPRRSDSQ